MIICFSVEASCEGIDPFFVTDSKVTSRVWFSSFKRFLLAFLSSPVASTIVSRLSLTLEAGIEELVSIRGFLEIDLLEVDPRETRLGTERLVPLVAFSSALAEAADDWRDRKAGGICPRKTGGSCEGCMQG